MANLKTLTKTVTTAGTQVALTTTTEKGAGVSVMANPANTGDIYLGASDVDAAKGIVLAAGDEYVFPAIGSSYRLKDIYIDSSVNGEGVRVLYGVA